MQIDSIVNQVVFRADDVLRALGKFENKERFLLRVLTNYIPAPCTPQTQTVQRKQQLLAAIHRNKETHCRLNSLNSWALIFQL